MSIECCFPYTHILTKAYTCEGYVLAHPMFRAGLSIPWSCFDLDDQFLEAWQKDSGDRMCWRRQIQSNFVLKLIAKAFNFREDLVYL